MKILFRQGSRLCIAKQSLVEAWVVATRPRDVNGFGYSPILAAEGLSKVKRLFHILPDADDIYSEWETRLVAAMNIHRIRFILTFNSDDFKRYGGIQILHPDQLIAR